MAELVLIPGVAILGALVIGVVVWVVMRGRMVARADTSMPDAMLHALPCTPIRDLVAGARVRVVGKAVGKSEYVKAPYSGSECLAFQGTQSLTLHVDNTYSAPRTIEGPSSNEARPFRVEDGTGAVEIAVEHALLQLVPRRVSTSDATAHVFGAKLLARGDTALDYEESVLLPGERVAVIGTVEADAGGGWRLTSATDAPLVISTRSAALLP